jgi:hypothetical protein
LPFNDLPSENPGTAGRIGEVGLASAKEERGRVYRIDAPANP